MSPRTGRATRTRRKNEPFNMLKAKAEIARRERGAASPKPKKKGKRRKHRKSSASRAPWTRKRARKAGRSLARRLLVGTLRGTGRVLFKTTPKAAGRGAVKTKQWVQAQKARQRFADDYTPEVDEIPYRARRLGARHECTACRRTFATTEGLGGHFDRVHADETPEAVRAKDPTKIISWTTGPRAGKFRVIPGGATAPGGRHRNDRKTRKERIAAANRAALNTRGQEAMAENEALQTIARGFRMLAEAPLEHRDDRPYLPLSELQALASGMEAIMGGLAEEAMMNVRSRMLRAGFPTHMANGLLAQGEHFTAIGTGFTQWYLNLSEQLDAQIRAARALRNETGPSVASLIS